MSEWDLDNWPDDEEAEPDETTYAQGRRADRSYVSKSFRLARPGSTDDGQPARFIYKVVDTESESALELDGESWVVRTTDAGRYQFKLLVAREAGRVKELWVQRVPAPGKTGSVKNIFNLRSEEAAPFIELLKQLPLIPIEGDDSVRVDDSLVRDLFADPNALTAVYNTDPDRFRRLISDDIAAQDVIASAARRTAVSRFRRLLEDDDYFDHEVETTPGRSRERVWQDFFEANPWIFGVTLSGQFHTAWSSEKLEQVVVGRSIDSVGKRTDALLRTSGSIRSMVFAEIKTHRTDLLGDDEYRSGCWSPSLELSGGVAQVQGTVHRATLEVGKQFRVADSAPDGSEIPGEHTYLLRPRCFLVVGRLDELRGQEGGVHVDKFRSFELYRRSLTEPEIITFDELLARAEWVVDTGEAEDSTGD